MCSLLNGVLLGGRRLIISVRLLAVLQMSVMCLSYVMSFVKVILTCLCVRTSTRTVFPMYRLLYCSLLSFLLNIVYFVLVGLKVTCQCSVNHVRRVSRSSLISAMDSIGSVIGFIREISSANNSTSLFILSTMSSI